MNPPILYVDVPAVQQQRGVLDCGVFAIAFAVHLALGDDVTKLNFQPRPDAKAPPEVLSI